MTMRRPLDCLRLGPHALIAVALTIERVAAAAPPPSDPDELIDQGNAAVDNGDLKKALAAWYEAWKLRPGKPDKLACNIGRAELRSGNNRAAAEWLSRCVRVSGNATTRKDLAWRTAEAAELNTARAKVAALRIDAEPGASVVVDHVHVGVSPLAEAVFLEPGEHRIEVQKGHRSAAATVFVNRGEERRVELAMKPREPAPASVPSSSSPPLSGAPPVGRRTPSISSSFEWWPALLGGGLSMGGITVGAILLVAVQGQKTEEEKIIKTILSETPEGCGQMTNHAQCPTLQAIDDRRVALTDAAKGVFIATGIVAAATIGYVIYENRRVTVAPTPVGVTVRCVW